MTIFPKTKWAICIFLGFHFFTSNVQAANDEKPVVVINGVKVGQDLLNQLVMNAVGQGGKDSPEMRAALENELIIREVLAQESRKQKLDQDSQVKAQLHLQQSALLAEILIAKHLEKVNTGDDKLRIEYKRQIDLLADAEEYQLSHIVTATEAEAKAVIKANKDGEPFDKLAKEKSVSPSRQSGGSLGWILSNQITPVIGNVVANMAVGAVTAMPVATAEGWQVVRLDGKRKYKAPSFEESKQQLINAVLSNERAEFIKGLVRAANVKR